VNRIGDVATWKDGPRYAPLTRPIAFEEPTSAVSLEPDQAPAVYPQPPVDPPQNFADQGTPVPLGSVMPAPASLRDPRTPFSTVSSVLTEEVAPGTARAPSQPYNVVSSAPVVTSVWAAPDPGQAPAAPVVRRVAAADCWAAAYPPFVITLGVAGIVGTVQSFLAVALLVASPFIFVPRVRFRVKQLRNINFGVIAALAVGWVITLILDSSMYNMDLDLTMWVLIGCWGLALADIFLQWLGLRNGETPTH